MSQNALANAPQKSFNIEKLSVQLEDGWTVVIDLKTRFSLDTIVDEPKVVCAATWSFRYANHPLFGRFDRSNLAEDIIPNINLYNVEILYGVGHVDSLINALITCDPGVFYASDESKPSFTVPASPNWGKTIRWDYPSENYSEGQYYPEDKAKDHFHFLNTLNALPPENSVGASSFVLNANLNIWALKYYVSKQQKFKLMLQQSSAKLRAKNTKLMSKHKGDLPDVIFNRFFSELEQDSSKMTGLGAVTKQLDLAKSGYAVVTDNLEQARSALSASSCAPKNSLQKLNQLSHYFAQYAQCAGKRKPLPKAYVLKKSFSLSNDDFHNSFNKIESIENGYTALFIKMKSKSSSMLAGSFLVTTAGKILSLDDIFEGDVDDSTKAYMVDLPDGDFVIYSSERLPSDHLRNVIHRFDKQGNRVTRYVLHDLDEAKSFTNYGSHIRKFQNSLEMWGGNKGELIVEWTPSHRGAKVRAVFSKNGSTLHQDITKKENDEWLPYENKYWSRQAIKEERAQANKELINIVWPPSKTGFTMIKANIKQFIDLSAMEYSKLTYRGLDYDNANSFYYSIDQQTHEVIMLAKDGRKLGKGEVINVHILQPVY